MKRHRRADKEGAAEAPRGASLFSRLSRPWLAGLITLAILAPFLNKAFHLDDTAFLRDARQILEAPLRPYDYEWNWYRSPQSRWVTSNNPPLNAYLLAAVSAAADGREFVFHAVYAVMAAGCAALMYLIARQFCRNAFLAAALTVASPAFLVSAGNVMAEIPMLGLWLLSVYLCLRPDGARLWGAGAAASAAVMTKYFAAALVPLLAVYFLYKHRRWTVHLAGLLMPVAVLVLWSWYSKAHGGVIHPLSAASYAVETARDLRPQTANTMAFLGGTLAWPLFLFPLAIRLRPAGLAAGAVLAGAVLWLGMGRVPEDVRGLWIVMAAGGIMTALFAAASWRARPDADSALLVLWLAGTIAFAMFFNWTVAARVILPAAFPAALLLVRWLESMEGGFAAYWTSWLKVAVALTLGLSFLLALVDLRHANASRTFVETTVRDLKRDHPRIWFSGHWGFQYYMEREGAGPFNYQGQDLAAGDLIVMPGINTNVRKIQVPMQPVTQRAFPNPYPFHLMSPTSHAGFYSSLYGPAPFSFSKEGYIDQFAVYRVTSVAPDGGQ